MVAYQLGTREVPGSNPGKGENFSMEINMDPVSPPPIYFNKSWHQISVSDKFILKTVGSVNQSADPSIYVCVTAENIEAK